MNQLRYLYLQKNQLSGPAPASIGNLTNLEKLVVDNNRLTGSIPPTWLRLRQLNEVKLNRNELTSVPDFSSITTLRSLDLRYNRLTFSSLLPNTPVRGFEYAPQRDIGDFRTIPVRNCNGTSIDVGFDQDILGSQYEWRRNENPFFTGSSPSLFFSREEFIQEQLFGSYVVKVTNPQLPGLTLTTKRITLQDKLNTPCTSEPQNYVQIETVLKRGKKSESRLKYLSHRERSTSYNYIDGLGRVAQQVDQAASPAGKDVVQPMVYDALGRTSKSYLPYVAGGAAGSYRDDATTQVGAFYQADGDNIADTDHPYAETIYEASPLSRVTEQGAVGNAWQPATPGAAGNKTIKMSHRTNTENEVKRLVLLANGDMKHEGYYPVGQIYVNETKDELNRAVWEYQDKRGQTVLKRVESEGSNLDTYYLYDDFGNLRVVVPPKLAVAIGSSVVSASLLTEGAYLYIYDARQRMISQQVPGADPV